MSLIVRGFQRIGMSVLNSGLPSSTITFTHQSNYSRFNLIRSFSSTIKPASKEEIEKLLKNKKIVVFMKGIPEEPRCGFSNAVVQILRMHGVTSYDSHDVLQNESIRQGIKEYSNWPTIPQVYINGEFVGGCDILVEMHKNGELVEHLEKAGIKSTLGEHEDKDKK